MPEYSSDSELERRLVKMECVGGIGGGASGLGLASAYVYSRVHDGHHYAQTSNGSSQSLYSPKWWTAKVEDHSVDSVVVLLSLFSGYLLFRGVKALAKTVSGNFR